MNLKKRILKELDDLQWIRDVELFVPFESAKRGELYGAKVINQRLADDLAERCDFHYIDDDKDYIVYVNGSHSGLSSEEVFCMDGYFSGVKFALDLSFYNMDDGVFVEDFWVTSSVVKIYPLEENIKSNFKKNNPTYYLGESDDLDWMRGGVYFDINEILGKKMIWRENNVNTLQDSGMQLQDIRKEDITFGPVRDNGGWKAVGINANGDVICRIGTGYSFASGDTFYSVEDVEKYVNLGIWVLLDDNGEPLNLF